MGSKKIRHAKKSPYGSPGNYRNEEHEKKCLMLFEACRKGDLYVVSQHLSSDTVNQADVNGRHSTPLHFAAGFGRANCVQVLISAGASVSCADDGGLVPLHNACSFGHTDVVRILLEKGADPNLGDNWGFTPLHEAAAKGKADVCIILLQHGASAFAENSDKKTPIDLADGDAKAVFTGEYRKDELLEAARSGNEQTVLNLLTPFNLNCHADDGRKSSLLHLAAGYNRVEVVKILLEKKAHIHTKDKGGLVPLHNACSFGHGEVVSLLLDAGASVLTEDLWNYTPLHEAANKGRLDVVKLLIARGGDPTKKNARGKAPIDLVTDELLRQSILNDYQAYQIYEASENGDVTVLRNLLSQPSITFFVHPSTGDTPLHVVARSQHLQRKRIAELLVSRGCPLEIRNKDFCTPLLVAVSSGNVEVAVVLIINGASLGASDRNGDTVLHLAAANGDLEFCRLAVREGAPVNARNRKGKMAAEVATSDAVREILGITDAARGTFHQPDASTNDENRCVARCSESEDQQDSNVESVTASRQTNIDSAPIARQKKADERKHLVEETKLLEAAKSGDLDAVVRIISDSPANINCKDFDGRESTPLHFAAGYNRIDVLRYLLEQGADVEARDTGGLVPLHNACAYGHLAIAELLVKHGADVNASDKWKYTPLHEAASKGKLEICKLLLLSGADPKRKGRDGKTPLDVVKEGADDVVDLLRGNTAVLEAARKGDIEKMRKILTPLTINCRDALGRSSTPLHLASGYNNLEVAQFLLENGASVNLQDRGGLIPLHNASSYGHLEIAALLIKHGAEVNQPDKWGYTPLHEAAQKGRTQICSLLLNNGADVCLKNYDGLTPVEVASAADTKELLMDAIPRRFAEMEDVKVVTAAASRNSQANITPNSLKSSLKRVSSSVGQTLTKKVTVDPEMPSTSKVSDESKAGYSDQKSPLNGISIQQFLKEAGLSELEKLFEKEEITLDLLANMGHDDLKAIGITTFGMRFRLLKNIEKLMQKRASGKLDMTGFPEVPSNFNGTVLVTLGRSDPEFIKVQDEMNATLVPHKDSFGPGGVYVRFEVVEVQKIFNRRLYDKYMRRCEDIREENDGEANERFLYHGSPFIHSIVQKGFDERHSYIGGMFGAGIYFAENSSKSNQYAFGLGSNGCSVHHDRSCYICVRHMLFCRVALGKSFVHTTSNKMAHSPPGHHSVVGLPCDGGLNYPEYVIYRGEQAYPEYVIVYRIANDDPS